MFCVHSFIPLFSMYAVFSFPVAYGMALWFDKHTSHQNQFPPNRTTNGYYEMAKDMKRRSNRKKRSVRKTFLKFIERNNSRGFAFGRITSDEPTCKTTTVVHDPRHFYTDRHTHTPTHPQICTKWLHKNAFASSIHKAIAQTDEQLTYGL